MRERFRMRTAQSIAQLSAQEIPLLSKEGWARPQENIAERPLMGRTGWLIHADGVTQPPRLRELMMLRDFFLIAQPPRLGNEGTFHFLCDMSLALKSKKTRDSRLSDARPSRFGQDRG